jgi:hypothetical protein
MTDLTTDLPKQAKAGATLVFLAGLFALLAGSGLFAAFLYNVTHPDGHWVYPGFSREPYSLNNIRQIPNDAISHHPIRDFGPALANYIVHIAHIESVNLMLTGLTVAVLARVGLRQRQKWAWYLVLVLVVWAAGNDTVAMISGGRSPYLVPVIPLILGLTGLAMVRRWIFTGPTKPA